MIFLAGLCCSVSNGEWGKSNRRSRYPRESLQFRMVPVKKQNVEYLERGSAEPLGLPEHGSGHWYGYSSMQ